MYVLDILDIVSFHLLPVDFYITFADVGNGHYQPLYNAPSQSAPAPVNYGATN